MRTLALAVARMALLGGGCSDSGEVAATGTSPKPSGSRLVRASTELLEKCQATLTKSVTRFPVRRVCLKG